MASVSEKEKRWNGNSQTIVVMDKSKYSIIQLHAALSLIGYWFFQSIFVRFAGESTQLSSIIYEGFQVALSLYVIVICRNSIRVGKKQPILFFYKILMCLYSLRIIVDILMGPFSNTVPLMNFLQDFLLIACLTFMAAWAMIASRKWLNVDVIAKWVFWLGIVAILFIRSDLQSVGMADDYVNQRISVSGGLTSLAVVRLSVFVVIAAIHLLLNASESKFYQLLYILGIIIGVWLSLASGSRGGVAGLVIALSVYFVFSSRHNIALIVVAVLAIAIFVINLVPILTWMADYFPVFSERMLLTVLENDQSTREEIRSQAVKVILENPVFGYSYRLYEYPSGYRTHNGILDVVLALGIPFGLLFFYFVYVKGSILAIKNMIHRDLFFPTVMMVFVLVSSLSSSSITDSGFNFAVCLLCATCTMRSSI